MSCFSVFPIVFFSFTSVKKLHSLVAESSFAERPEQSQGSRGVAGDSFTLDGGKG